MYTSTKKQGHNSAVTCLEFNGERIGGGGELGRRSARRGRRGTRKGSRGIWLRSFTMRETGVVGVVGVVSEEEGG